MQAKPGCLKIGGIGCGGLIGVVLLLGAAGFITELMKSPEEKAARAQQRSERAANQAEDRAAEDRERRQKARLLNEEAGLEVRNEPAMPKRLDELVSTATIDSLGKTVNWDGRPSSVVSIDLTEQVDGEDAGGYLASIAYRANDNITLSFARRGLVNDASELIQRLSTDPELESVRIYLLMPRMRLVDKYGQVREEQVGKFVLRKAVADRINWDNMTTEGFERILRTDGEFRLLGPLNN